MDHKVHNSKLSEKERGLMAPLFFARFLFFKYWWYTLET